MQRRRSGRRAAIVRKALPNMAAQTTPASCAGVPHSHRTGFPRSGGPTVGEVPRSLDADAGSLLIWTDFSDDQAWARLLVDAQRPSSPDGFTASFVPISDEAYEGLRAEELASLDGDAFFLYAADRLSMHGPERTLLVVDRLHDRGRWFRVTLEEAWAVENNLSLFNMDFFEFADAVDDDGVYRVFR